MVQMLARFTVSFYFGLCSYVLIAEALFDWWNMMGPGSCKSVPSGGKDGARSHSCRSLNAILQLDVISARKM